MSRRYVKRRTFGKRNKYSVEQTVFTLTLPVVTSTGDNLESQNSIAIVPPTDVQGKRKAKNFTISFASTNNQVGGSEDRSFYYALVYVPQGYQTGILYNPGSNNARTLYSANQYVISAGIIDLSAGPQRIFSKLSRNLNSGDNIYLILKNTSNGGEPFAISGVITYAITLQ